MIEQPVRTDALHFELGLDVYAEAQQQLLGIDRVAPQLPRAGAQRLELLRADRVATANQDDGCGRGKRWIGAQGAAEVEARPVRQLRIEQHTVGLPAADLRQSGFGIARRNDAEAARHEEAVQGAQQPLVANCEEDERRRRWWRTCTVSHDCSRAKTYPPPLGFHK